MEKFFYGSGHVIGGLSDWGIVKGSVGGGGSVGGSVGASVGGGVVGK